MASFFNDSLTPIVQETIENFKRSNVKTFSTIDAIKEQVGRYYNDHCSAHKSFNANFGKFLKENEEALGIKEIRSDVSMNDDAGQPTLCSVWEII